MKIIIKEREVEYDTDYPHGWKFSAGDPFKVPVMINNYKCFIKRFDKKASGSITGWPLLIELKGKFEPNLPRVYDCKEVQEKEQAVNYIFYECIDGKTLEQAIHDGDEPDLVRLTNDLFSGLQSLHQKEFWFADFCEKNIFCEDGGRYLLVDLDSTESTTQLPDNEMYGSKDYWIPVYRFYKDILKKENIRLHDITGAALNYLQVIFLVLHLKQFYTNKTQKYKADEQYTQLPALLSSRSAAAGNYFLQVLQSKNPTPDFIAGIKNVILHDLLGVASSSLPLNDKLSIKQFTTNKAKLNAGESFTLNWEVDGATQTELLRNGEVIETHEKGTSQTTRAEFNDGASRDVVYELNASSGISQIKSAPLIIKKQAKNKTKAATIWAIGIAALMIIVLFLFLNRTKDKPEILISQEQFLEDSTIIIYGKKLPPTDVLTIAFNKQATNFTSRTDDSIYVKIPSIEVNSAGTPVLLEISSGTMVIFSSSQPYIPAIAIYDMQSNLRRIGTSTITVTGKNLGTARSIKATLRNKSSNESMNGTIDNIQKDRFNINFYLAPLYAAQFNATSVANDGFIQAGYWQPAPQRQPYERLLTPIRERFPGIRTIQMVSISVSVQIDQLPPVERSFWLGRFSNPELSMDLDTLILDRATLSINQ